MAFRWLLLVYEIWNIETHFVLFIIRSTIISLYFYTGILIVLILMILENIWLMVKFLFYDPRLDLKMVIGWGCSLIVLVQRLLILELLPLQNTLVTRRALKLVDADPIEIFLILSWALLSSHPIRLVREHHLIHFPSLSHCKFVAIWGCDVLDSAQLESICGKELFLGI